MENAMILQWNSPRICNITQEDIRGLPKLMEISVKSYRSSLCGTQHALFELRITN